MPAPPGTRTWPPTCCISEPGSWYSKGSPVPRCRSSSRASAWPAASANPSWPPPASAGRTPPTLQGDHAGAVRDAAEALRLSRQAGDQRQVGQMLGNLGNFELAAGELDAARGHLAESLDIARALNNRYGIPFAASNLGLAEYLATRSVRPRLCSRNHSTWPCARG